MRFGSFKYLVKQGFKSIWLNRLMSVASIGVLAACLLLTGSAYLFSVNVEAIVGYVEKQNEVVLILRDDITQDQMNELSDAFTSVDNIDSVVYISKEQALEDSVKEFGSLMEGLEESNPLPASYRLKLKDLSLLEETETVLEKYPQIETIKAPTSVADTLTSVKQMVSVFGVTVVSILTVVSLVIISNTIKISLFNRRKEINIMKFVGATDAFIRFPFVVEGIILGIISSGIAYGLVYGGYRYVSDWLGKMQSSWISDMTTNIIPFSQLNIKLLAAFLVVGILTGMLGSSASIKKYLKV